MDTNELVRQNELAEALLAKLERIKTLWAELPAEDELNDLCHAAGAIQTQLQQAKETFVSGDFPSTTTWNRSHERPVRSPRPLSKP